MIRQEIAKLIEKSIKELQRAKKLPKFDLPEVQIEHPEEKTNGDYAANIAMVVARQTKKSPMEIAKLINFQFPISNSQFLEKTQVVEPGFINFFLSEEYLQKQVAEIMRRKEKFGDLKIGKNQ